VTGMIEWGQKSKPKKVNRASNEPQKIPGPTPQNSHAEFLSFKLKINPERINPQVTSETYQEFSTAKGNSSDDKHDG